MVTKASTFTTIIREHGMAATMNGMALHGGVIPYSGTFLSFADYCRPSIRLAALMKQRAVFVMTHDSIGLGEDGPTHQPVEHLASLRCAAFQTCWCYAQQMVLKQRNAGKLPCNSKPAQQYWCSHVKTCPAYCAANTDNKSTKGAYVLSESKASRHLCNRF